MRKRNAILAEALLFGAAACGGSDEGAAPAEPSSVDSAAVATETGATEIKVGLLVPQNGLRSELRTGSAAEIDLALADLGVDSSVAVEIITADEDVLDATVTLERVKKLVDRASEAKLAGESSPRVVGTPRNPL